MFKTTSKPLKELSLKHHRVINLLEKIFSAKTNVYIDYANVFHWQDKLGYHIDFKRLKQLFNAFSNINEVKIYQGELEGDSRSVEIIKDLKEQSYIVRTKPVKIMNLPIDVSSIPLNSPAILKDFVNKSLLGKLDIETVEFLNSKLVELNMKGMKSIKHLKCNFDVEIASDMVVDSIKDPTTENFILWSGDSDFADTISQLSLQKKKVVVFATARKVSRELSETGSYIFDIKKIKDFICWKREIT